MKKCLYLTFVLIVACNSKPTTNKFLTATLPNEFPIPFMPEIIPDSMLVHSGIFSPDLEEFYYTLSDKKFQQFDVKVIRKNNGSWSTSSNSFFNTEYNEHGTSFSADGNYIYFSSTRPTNTDSVENTWHIWRSKKVNNKWKEAELVDIPNKRDKLTSHPSLSKNGILYFHSGNIDYSDLQIYYSIEKDGKFTDAVKLPNEINFATSQNTPFIALDESYLIYESASKLFINCKYEDGSWSIAKELNSSINKNGRGNPFVTGDQKYLIFAAGVEPNPKDKWGIFWVSTKGILQQNN